MVARHLSDVNHLGVAASEREYAGVDQPVVDDHIRSLEKALALERQELGVAGAGSYQVDGSPDGLHRPSRMSEAPASISFSARTLPPARGSEASKSSLCRNIRTPSGEEAIARILSMPPATLAKAATGALHPPPMARRKARSATHGGPGLCVVGQGGDPRGFGVILPYLHDERSLPHVRSEDLGVQVFGCPVCEPQALQPGGCHHHPVVVTGSDPCDSSSDIAPDGDDPYVGAHAGQEGGPARAAGAQPGTGRQGGQRGVPAVDQDISRVPSLAYGGYGHARKGRCRKVLGAVHRGVDLPVQQGPVDLMHEHATLHA